MSKLLEKKKATLVRKRARYDELEIAYEQHRERLSNEIDEIVIDIELIENRVDQRKVRHAKYVAAKLERLNEEYEKMPDELKEAAVA